MALIEVKNLVKVYTREVSLFGGEKQQFRAVDDVSLVIQAGETLGLVGESGCGKSTLGRLILRLLEPTSGEVFFDGHQLSKANASTMRRLRRHMQIVFQDPYSSLNPRMRVREIITEPLKIHGLSASGDRHDDDGRDERESRNRADESRPLTATELMRTVGLDESALGRYPHEFSGGQRQRIAIARALALRPKFIVADEPVSSLDVSRGAQIVNLLRQLQVDFGLTYLFISHSMPIVRYLATRIAVMYAGKIVEIGETEQVTQKPSHPYTHTLLQATPQLDRVV